MELVPTERIYARIRFASLQIGFAYYRVISMEDLGILPPKELASVDKTVFNTPKTHALTNSEARPARVASY